jgi:hypothetical protein
MCLYYFIIAVLLFWAAPLYSGDSEYFQQDFYNRYIELPIDYDNPAAGGNNV